MAPPPAGPPLHSAATNGYQLAVRSSLYLFSATARRLANLLLVPLLINLATPAEFSRYGLMLSLLTVAVPLLSLNLHLAPTRLIFDHPDHGGRADLLVSVAAGALGQAAVLLALLLLALRASGLADPISGGSFAVQLAVAGTVIASIGLELGLLLMRVCGRAGAHGAVELVHGLGLLALFLALAARFDDIVATLAFTHCAVTALAAALALGWTRTLFAGGRPRAPLLAAAARYAAPTVLHVVTLWLVASGGRWIGAIHLPLEDLALYTLLTLAISVLGILPRTLVGARLPEIGTAFAAGRLERGARTIRGAIGLSVAVIVLFYLGTWLLLPIVEPRIPAAYRPTGGVLWMALAANLFDALYLRAGTVLSSLKRTPVQAMGTAIAGLAFVPLALLAAAAFGSVGLLGATVAGYALQAAVAGLLARRELQAAVAGIGASAAG